MLHISYDPWSEARLDEAVRQRVGERGGTVADCERISKHNGGRDGGEVVGKEGAGLGAAGAVDGGVVTLGGLRGLRERVQQLDHGVCVVPGLRHTPGSTFRGSCSRL